VRDSQLNVDLTDRTRLLFVVGSVLPSSRVELRKGGSHDRESFAYSGPLLGVNRNYCYTRMIDAWHN